MQILDKRLLEQLSEELTSLCSDMLEAEASLLKQHLALLEVHRLSARNLVHYLALRRRDIRELQTQLTLLGLSSLGRAESHVFSTVLTVLRAMNALLGITGSLPFPKEPLVEVGEGTDLLKANTDALLGAPPSSRKVRIMVTMSSDAATDYELVRDLLQKGMDCMRINCAHDGPEIWLGMIRNLRKAQEETGLSCRVLMDLAGPKLRTGPIEPGPAVIKCRPIRDVYGRVVTPARIWLTPSDNPEPAPDSAAACIPLSVRFLKQLRTGDTIHLRDARRAKRTLRISRVLGSSCWAKSRQTIYFKPGVQIYGTSHAESATDGVPKNMRTSVGDLPALPQVLLLKPGDTLILERGSTLGRPAVYGKTGGTDRARQHRRLVATNAR
jgi:pyruvate kinase